MISCSLYYNNFMTSTCILLSQTNKKSKIGCSFVTWLWLPHIMWDLYVMQSKFLIHSIEPWFFVYKILYVIILSNIWSTFWLLITLHQKPQTTWSSWSHNHMNASERHSPLLLSLRCCFHSIFNFENIFLTCYCFACYVYYV